MTFPIISTHCDRCGYSPQNRYDGPAKYQFPDGQLLSVNSTSAWCRQCANLELVEKLDPSDWLEEVRFVRGRLSSLQSKKKLLGTHWTYDGQRSPYLSDESRADLTPETIADWVNRIDTALAGIAFLRIRTSPARCLSCGGTDFELAKCESDPHDLERQLIVHPGCGGLLRSEIEGDFFISGERASKRYTPEGVFVGWFKGNIPLEDS